MQLQIGINIISRICFSVGIAGFVASVIAYNLIHYKPEMNQELLAFIDNGGEFLAIVVGYLLFVFSVYWLATNFKTLKPVYTALLVLLLVLFFEFFGYLLVAYLIFKKRKDIEMNSM